MKRNKGHCVFTVLFLSFLLCACGGHVETADEVLLPEMASVTDPMDEYITQRCAQIADVYYDLYMDAEKTAAENAWSYPSVSQETVDAIEALLLEAGFDVLDSSSGYPSYLATADRFHEFWDHVQRGEPARQEIAAVSTYGILEYRLFVYDADAAEGYVYSMSHGFAPDIQPNYEAHRIIDWDVTEKGNFYYQIRATDHLHYEDYSLIRLTAPDKALWDLNSRCILPVGYTAANLFLVDWSESDWRGLSFNDLWEYFYLVKYGSPYVAKTEEHIPGSKRYRIPAEDFEGLVKPYFQISLETFRELAQYQPEVDGYLWRPVEPNDFDFLGYYACAPEVTACRDNADGTLTLTVEVLSTDLKTDCLFSHEVTIRLLDHGSFQYVSNRITYQTDYGLPFGEPRQVWD